MKRRGPAEAKMVLWRSDNRYSFPGWTGALLLVQTPHPLSSLAAAEDWALAASRRGARLVKLKLGEGQMSTADTTNV